MMIIITSLFNMDSIFDKKIIYFLNGPNGWIMPKTAFREMKTLMTHSFY